MKEQIEELIAEKQKLIDACKVVLNSPGGVGVSLYNKLIQEVNLFETFIEDLEKLVLADNL